MCITRSFITATWSSGFAAAAQCSSRGLEDVPEESRLLFSAHGISPEVRAKAAARRLKTIDATCPLVTKVHLEAVRFARQGYTILLVGHEGHDEVVAARWAKRPNAFVLVQSPEDVDRLEFPPDTRLAYLTQTTLSVDDANRIIGRLRERFPQIVGPPKEDICYATQNRQEAVRLLASEVQVCLVLGSQNSSNSQRLAELARASPGIATAHLIDDAVEVDLDWFRGDENVLVTVQGPAALESGRARLCRTAAKALRRHGRAAHTPRGGSLLPAAARAARDQPLNRTLCVPLGCHGQAKSARAGGSIGTSTGRRCLPVPIGPVRVAANARAT